MPFEPKKLSSLEKPVLDVLGHVARNQPPNPRMGVPLAKAIKAGFNRMSYGGPQITRLVNAGLLEHVGGKGTHVRIPDDVIAPVKKHLKIE